MSEMTDSEAFAARRGFSDRTVSWIRTVVPGIWAAAVTTFLTWASPSLPGDTVDGLSDLLGGEVATSLIMAATLAVWYWVWRRLEAHVPSWMARLALGSARTPVYP